MADLRDDIQRALDSAGYKHHIVTKLVGKRVRVTSRLKTTRSSPLFNYQVKLQRAGFTVELGRQYEHSKVEWLIVTRRES